VLPHLLQLSEQQHSVTGDDGVRHHRGSGAAACNSVRHYRGSGAAACTEIVLPCGFF